MITIIYGEDTAASRNYLFAERNKHSEKAILDGASLTLTDLLQALSGSGLFGDQQAIFIDELLSKRKTSKELEEIISSIVNSQSSIFIWESKDLTAKQLSSFKKATVKQFKIPATVFAFLDALLPKNGEKLVTLFHELLKDEDVNFALFMLQRQVRLLLALSNQEPVIPDLIGDPGKGIDSRLRHAERGLRGNDTIISEVKRLAPWQKGKMEKQAKQFTSQQLIELHTKLYKLELGQKTGGLSMPLEQELDFLLASL